MKSYDDLIRRRRSIRRYKPDVPAPMEIEAMLFCATQAPSPSNVQPVRFLNMKSPEIRERLRQGMEKGRQRLLEEAAAGDKPKHLRNLVNYYWRYSEFMFRSPILMAAGAPFPLPGFAQPMSQARIIAGDFHQERDADISLGLALMAFILKGEELGLGACILTAPLLFVTDIEKILNTPDMRIKCFVAVGYPDEEPGDMPKKGIAEVYREL